MKLFSELKHIDSDKAADEHGFGAASNAKNLDEEKTLDLSRLRLIKRLGGAYYRLKDKLARPPLEINNVQWLMIDGDKLGNLVSTD